MSSQSNRSTFISYSRTNTNFAIKLALELRSAGFDIWLDQLDIPPGARWDDEVESALARCEIFMVILTPASIASDNVKDEIGYAIDTRKRILPILLENATLPLRLRRFQYVDFTSKGFDDGVESAKQLLKRLTDQPTLPNLQIPAPFRTQEAGANQGAQEQGEQVAGQQGETERKAKEEAEYLASQRAEEERIHKEEMEAQHLAAEKAEEDRKAREEAERKAREEAEKERLAFQKAQADRIAWEKKEAERFAAQRAKEEREAEEKTVRELEGRPAQTEAQVPQPGLVPVPQQTETIQTFPKKKSQLPWVAVAGAGLVVVLIIGMVVLRNLSGGDIPTTGAQENNLSGQQTAATSAPLTVEAEPTKPPEPTALPPTKTAIPPSPTPEVQQFFTETFQGDYSDHWRYFLRSGDESKFSLTSTGDGLLFELNDQQIYAYLVYEPFEYEEVRMDVTVENLGVNENNITLFCRYSPESGWYEFNIYSSGLFDIYFTKPDAAGNLNYGRFAEGGSNKIKTGKATNTYSIICTKDSLTLLINGVETRTVGIPDYVLENGKVGVSASSFQSTPVQVKFKEVKISKP